MNNYWHTNYCAYQEGKITSRHILYPHKKYQLAVATAQGISAAQPLLVIPMDKNTKPFEPFVQYKNDDVFMVSMQPLDKGSRTWIALYNAARDDTELQLNFRSDPKRIYTSDLLKNKLIESGSSLSIPGMGLTCLLIEW